MRAIAAWLGVVVVALGWMQSLLVCARPCCGGRVKLTPRCEREADAQVSTAAARYACPCCGARADAPDDVEAPERASAHCCDGCVHVALGVELDLPPDDAVAEYALPPRYIAALPRFVVAPATDRPVVHPPATGPPRADARVALRATTLLLL